MPTLRRLRRPAVFPLLLILFAISGSGATKQKALPADVNALTDDGRTVHFYSDLVRGRVVAINFIFTSCTTVCPLMGARFAQLQRLLQKPGSGGGNVSLISVSIDPATDTPARLAAWARRMGARPGWTLVTGTKPDMDTLTQSLGASSADPASHAPLIVIIDDRNGRWQRLDGLTDPAVVARILRDVVELTLNAQQQRGKAIYVHGQSTAGRPITAVLGDEGDGVPAALVPCANCHGEDGRGKPEGSVLPADITPESLARSSQANGRTRPVYTRPLLKRAITMGFDSGRAELNAAMPRYRMAMQDAEDLLAYLEIVGHEGQPGVSNDVIRIKLVGDTGEPRGAEIYGRRLEFVRQGEALFTIDASDDPIASVAAAERDHIPTIVVHAPVSINPYVFALTAGDDEQRAALRTFTHGKESVMIEGDCTASLARTAALRALTPPLVLMTAAVAKTCDLAAIPAALDRTIIVAAPLPPTPNATRDATAAAVAITTSLLARLGRDVTRAALVNALEHVHHVETRLLPPITWEANRHGARAAWLMTVDVKAGRLLAEPGWVEGE